MRWTSFEIASFVVLTTSFVGHVLVMYCSALGIAESKVCIEQQITFLCDCKCAVHLAQLSNAGVLKPVPDDDVRVVVAPEEAVSYTHLTLPTKA